MLYKQFNNFNLTCNKKTIQQIDLCKHVNNEDNVFLLICSYKKLCIDNEHFEKLILSFCFDFKNYLNNNKIHFQNISVNICDNHLILLVDITQ